MPRRGERGRIEATDGRRAWFQFRVKVAALSPQGTVGRGPGGGGRAASAGSSGMDTLDDILAAIYAIPEQVCAPPQPRFLHDLSAQTAGRGEVVEIGTMSGKSTTALAFAQKRPGGRWPSTSTPGSSTPTRRRSACAASWWRGRTAGASCSDREAGSIFAVERLPDASTPPPMRRAAAWLKWTAHSGRFLVSDALDRRRG